MLQRARPRLRMPKKVVEYSAFCGTMIKNGGVSKWLTKFLTAAFPAAAVPVSAPLALSLRATASMRSTPALALTAAAALVSALLALSLRSNEFLKIKAGRYAGLDFLWVVFCAAGLKTDREKEMIQRVKNKSTSVLSCLQMILALDRVCLNIVVSIKKNTIALACFLYA